MGRRVSGELAGAFESHVEPDCRPAAPLQVLALCHIAVGQQMNLHWLHKVRASSVGSEGREAGRLAPPPGHGDSCASRSHSVLALCPALSSRPGLN